jgi:CRISPR-associated protein Csd2
MTLTRKIDFAVIVSVRRANPNGDPLNGNRPRQNYEGYGEISDVCLKRKIRNRMQDMGVPILVQSDDRRQDIYRSIKERVDAQAEMKKLKEDKSHDSEVLARMACQTWGDVRSFGQVFAFSGEDKAKGVSIGVRGPVSIHTAVSVDPVDISSMQITKSVNTDTAKDPNKKSSDTMGMKHRIDFGVYVFYGSINTQLAEKTGFTDADAQMIRQALITLFENDASSARPDGSMEVHQVYWWEHPSPNGKYSSAKVHRSLHIARKVNVSEAHSLDDYDVTVDTLEGLPVQIYGGI